MDEKVMSVGLGKRDPTVACQNTTGFNCGESESERKTSKRGFVYCGVPAGFMHNVFGQKSSGKVCPSNFFAKAGKCFESCILFTLTNGMAA